LPRRARLPPDCRLRGTWIFEIERRELFDALPRFVGRNSMVPRQGDYAALDGANAGQLLVRNGSEVRMVSNVCRHR
jgi:choline monooxygenase